jgi:hypothetical protein
MERHQLLKPAQGQPRSGRAGHLYEGRGFGSAPSASSAADPLGVAAGWSYWRQVARLRIVIIVADAADGADVFSAVDRGPADCLIGKDVASGSN